MRGGILVFKSREFLKNSDFGEILKVVMWVFGLKMGVEGRVWGIWVKWVKEKVRKSEKKCEILQKNEKNGEEIAKF